jgi:hypothetical protein
VTATFQPFFERRAFSLTDSFLLGRAIASVSVGFCSAGT